MAEQEKDRMYSSTESYERPTYPNKYVRRVLKDIDASYRDKKPSKLQQGLSVAEGLSTALVGGSIIKEDLDRKDRGYSAVEKYLKGVSPEIRKKYKIPTRAQVRLGADKASYGDFDFNFSDMVASQTAKGIPPELLKLLNMMPNPDEFEVPEEE